MGNVDTVESDATEIKYTAGDKITSVLRGAFETVSDNKFVYSSGTAIVGSLATAAFVNMPFGLTALAASSAAFVSTIGIAVSSAVSAFTIYNINKSEKDGAEKFQSHAPSEKIGKIGSIGIVLATAFGVAATQYDDIDAYLQRNEQARIERIAAQEKCNSPEAKAIIDKAMNDLKARGLSGVKAVCSPK